MSKKLLYEYNEDRCLSYSINFDGWQICTLNNIAVKNFDTLSEAINALKTEGYDNDFNLHPDWIECAALKIKFKPEEFHVDEIHRFEGMSNPDDNSVLFAISSSDGKKGLLVDAYGVYSDSLSKVMIDKLRIDGNTKA